LIKKLYFSTIFSFTWQNIPRIFGNSHFDLEKKRGDIYFQVAKSGDRLLANVLKMHRSNRI